MADFHFFRPFWLLTLLPIVLIWWGFLKQQDQLSRWRETIDSHLLEHLLVGEQKKSWFRPVHSLLVVWTVTAFALAGPTWQKEPSPFLNDEAGLMVLLKVSKSMESTDVKPSRLTRAKHKLRDLMALRQGAATGLIVYSGSVHLVMPLTRDDRIINTMLEGMTPEVMPVEGDQLSEALELGEQMVKQSGVSGSLLVIADSVASGQSKILAANGISLPVQFLSMLPPGAPIDRIIAESAGKLNAPITYLSLDSSDVERVVSRAKTEFDAVTEPRQGDRWKDNGYLILPLTALCMLLWFRKGWVVQ